MIDSGLGIPDRPSKDVAERVLRTVGVRQGQTVLDFGCGKGTYTIPAARIVGHEAVVYAVDEDDSKIHTLRNRIQSAGLHNIRVLPAIARAIIGLPDQSADVILLYDVLHSWYHPQSRQRKAILNELSRVLRPDGFLSFYPGDPEVFGKRGELSNILEEIKQADFRMEAKYTERLVHEGSLVDGHIFRFVRRHNGIPST